MDLDQFRGDWNQFTTHFSRYFSTQGRNIKHLHERWRTFSFDPANDDIKEYIRDVKEAAKQLGHGDDAVINLLKATMPTELYGTLYGHNNLPQLCTMLKDIYAHKLQAAASSTTTTPGTSAPFTMIKASPMTPEPTLEDKLTHLTDTLYRMDIDSKKVEGLEEVLIGEEVEKEDGLVSLDNLIEETDLLVIEEDLDLDDLLKNLTKVLTTRGPEYWERLLIKTK